MKSEEQVMLDYQNNRRRLEVEEDRIQSFNRKGERVIDSAYQDLEFDLRNNELDRQDMAIIQQEINRAQEKFNETLQQEKRTIRQKLEDSEVEYKQELAKLNESKDRG